MTGSVPPDDRLREIHGLGQGNDGFRKRSTHPTRENVTPGARY
jgi:hypothetical protein